MNNTQRSRPMEARFVCNHCKHVFKLERRYLTHVCKQMKKQEELKSPKGQAALGYYHTWMKQLKRTPPSPSTFLTSKLFRTFIEFVTFSQSVNLPRPDKFIWLMVQKGYQPTMWRLDAVYGEYIEFLDRKQKPLDQANLSIDTLFTYTTQHNNIDISEVFEVLNPNELIQMLRRRNVSPWLLLFSKKFGEFYRNKVTPEQKIILDTLIQFSYWKQKIADHPEDVADIKKYIEALNL